MLDLKGIDYELAAVVPGTQRVHLRLVGFRGGTVPALRLDGRRVQGSRAIARALDQLRAEPPLFPAEPAARVRVEEAERWGDEELQAVPRRILRWGLVQHTELRRWLAEQSGLPAPAVGARIGVPAAWRPVLLDRDDDPSSRAARLSRQRRHRSEQLLTTA